MLYEIKKEHQDKTIKVHRLSLLQNTCFHNIRDLVIFVYEVNKKKSKSSLFIMIDFDKIAKCPYETCKYSYKKIFINT